MPVTVNTRSAPASSGNVDDTGKAFIAAKNLAADTTAHLVRSIADFEAVYGARTGAAVAAWDWLDHYFREKGQAAYVAGYTTVYADALALFPKALGPGQLVVLGETPAGQLATDMAAHAQANNRVGIFDVANGSTLSAMQTLGDALPATAVANGEYLAAFAPWLNIAPPMGVVGGAERTVPPSALVCGLCARVEEDGNPNRAAGGRDYAAQYVDAVTLKTTQTDRDNLLTHKVNAVTLVNGLFEVYSFQTPVPQDPSTPFWQFNCARARMWMRHQAYLIGENYYMRNIDAEGHLAGALKTDLSDMLMDLYSVDGLFGHTSDEAFSVNVGSAVNNDLTAAGAALNAVAQAKLSLYAKSVQIDLVSVPISGQVT